MKKKYNGFTLAEVLITLGIIGVVAALTMPTLIQNHQKQVWTTQLKKTYSMWSQAFQKILVDEGVEKLSDTTLWSKLSQYGLNLTNTPARNQAFYEELQKYLSFEIPTTLENDSWGGKSYRPKFSDGSLMMGKTDFLANPDEKSSSECNEIKNQGGTMCSLAGVFMIDVNGDKKPNQMGRDIFYFAVSNEGRLYPYRGKDMAIAGYDNYWNFDDTSNGCNFDEKPHGDNYGCAARIIENGWKMDY